MFLEMRTYVLKPGMTNNFVERFAEGLTARLQFSKLLGLWQSEVGGLNRVVHIWPYESFEDRERIGQEARKTGKWPPKTQEFIITQENKIIQPAPFSPPLPEGKLGNVYEFRTYTYQPGTMPTVLERFGKVMAARTKVSPLVFAGHTLCRTAQSIHSRLGVQRWRRTRPAPSRSLKDGGRMAACDERVPGDAGKHVDDPLSMRAV